MKKRLISTTVVFIILASAATSFIINIEPNVAWRPAFWLGFPIVAASVIVGVILFAPWQPMTHSSYRNSGRLDGIMGVVAGALLVYWVAQQLPGANWANLGWATFGATLVLGAVVSLAVMFASIARVGDDYDRRYASSTPHPS